MTQRFCTWAVVLFSLVGCAQAAPPVEEEAGSPGPDVEVVAPEVLIAMSAELLSATRSRDAAGVASFFADTGVMVTGGGGALEGPDEVAAFWSERWEGADGPNPLAEWDVVWSRSGPHWTEVGGFGPEEIGQPVGDFVRTWVMIDGEWKLLLLAVLPR